MLKTERKEFEVSNQLVRSGTSIGANVREAINAQSTADFIHKLSIAQKEADETVYWLELLLFTNTISKIEFESINTDAVEILKIIKKIIITTKTKSEKI